MDVPDILLEFYGRIAPLARASVEGLTPDQLCKSPTPGTNNIGWLVWHLARVQDHHFAEAFEINQVWVDGDWGPRFGLQSDPANIGYGLSADEMARVKPDQLSAPLDYLDAVEAQTHPMIKALSSGDLDRIVDRRWDPPVSLGVRLVSVADDGLQHVGQASYLRGMFDF